MGHSYVARQREFAPAAEGMAVDACDDRLWEVGDDLVHARSATRLSLFEDVSLSEFRDVGARDERLRLVGTGHHHDPCVAVCDAVYDPLQLSSNLCVEGVARVG